MWKWDDGVLQAVKRVVPLVDRDSRLNWMQADNRVNPSYTEFLLLNQGQGHTLQIISYTYSEITFESGTILCSSQSNVSFLQ